MSLVEISEEIFLDVFGRFPASVFGSVSLPIDKIGDSSVSDFEVQDFVDLVDFVFGFYEGFRRRVRLSARESIGSMEL